MLKILKPLADIAFFSRGPDILPSSNAFIGLVIVLFSVATAVAFYVAKLSMMYLLPTLLLSIAAYAVLTLVPLRIAQKQERVAQTFAAFLGTDAVITLLTVPALFLLVNFPSDSLSYQLGQASYLLTLIWSIAVIAVILNAAMEWEKIFGFMLAPVYFFSLVLIGQMLFGADGG
ncbi:MAG: hypothetical protein KJO88_03125 [Gammaproteobacteria bacterium]|nr:hypothetical protein [Gammaproteobacteria bacterium]